MKRIGRPPVPTGTRRLAKDGYVRVKQPDHPRSWSHGWMLEHILIVERAMGKSLRRSARVHHVDEDRSNNSNTNLVVCQDDAYHQLLHMRAEAYRACGNPDWRRCIHCGEHDDPSLMAVQAKAPRKVSLQFVHVDCRRAAWLRWSKSHRGLLVALPYQPMERRA